MKPRKPDDLEAPGLNYRERRTGWNLYWIAQTRIVKRGYRLSTVRLWPATDAATPTEPTREEWAWISSECERLQGEMLHWAGGGKIDDARSRFDDTLSSLIEIYETDPDSPFRELRHRIQRSYATRLAVIKKLVGSSRLSTLTFRDFKRWHEAFKGENNATTYAHALITHVRLVMSFGKLLRLGNCAQLVDDLSGMRFEGAKKRREFMTAAQCVRFREIAHREGLHSIALAQAVQFELMMRQKDVIGEWIPLREPGVSNISDGHEKWMHGLHWREVSSDLILSKRISKSLRGRGAVLNPDAGKLEEYDLRAYPMVVEELGFFPDRERIGPLIICDFTGMPWRESTFRHEWRRLATLAGIPKTVQNRDSRAGGITEGRKAGARLEDLRHHAGHSQITTTARYDRGDVETKSNIAHLRTRSRKT